MNANGYSLTRLYDLGLRALEDVITDKEFTELSEILAGDSGAVEKYFDLMMAHTSFCKLSNRILSDTDEHIKSIYEPSLWQEMLEYEKTAVAVEEEPTEKSVEPWQGMVKVEKPKRVMSRFSIYTLALSAAAVLLFMVMVLLSPVRPIVATLTDSINAEWISEEEIPADGEVLRQGELTLARGFAEITFDNGAVVVVEGPAIIELESPKAMFVTSGKISAVVSDYATGFTVNTLSASIVDLGTEFGVSVEGDGSCSLHMFKGKANLIAGKKDQRKIGQIVNVNEARSVDYMTGVVEEIKLSEKGFVRQIDSENGFTWRGERLNLADVVGGGNGLGTGLVGGSINPATGQTSEVYDNRTRTTDGKCHLVESLPFVNSVFIPSGGIGPVEISSERHVFSDCPVTDGNVLENISNSGLIHPSGAKPYPMMLGGKEYGISGQPAIYMHANSGITFDLENIRSAFPGMKLDNFSALCGVSENTSEYTDSDGTADFYVLVDGVKRFETKKIASDPTPERVKILIEQKDRFLTLITTDSDGVSSLDWCLYAEPMLELSIE